MFRILLIALLFLSNDAFTQDKDADEIIKKMQTVFDGIKDYKVDMTISVDMSFLKVPKSKATLYFKQPDKVKLDSKGFAMLPKEGLTFSPGKMLDFAYSAFYIKEEKVGESNTHVIKIIPNADTARVLLTTLWVDSKFNILRKIKSTTKSAGEFEIELTYADPANIKLPSTAELTFTFDQNKIPARIRDEIQKESKDQKNQNSMNGKVTIRYENYSINKGLPDDLFKEDQ